MRSVVRRFRHTFIVKTNINKIWEFYTDIGHLNVISPPDMQLTVVKSTHKRLVKGSEVWLTGILVTRSNWHSRIVSLDPYEYVDEMLTGRFHVWRHLHGFRKIDDDSTEVIDEINFELHCGLLGKVFEGYVYFKLKKIFAYREQATIKVFED